MIRRLLVANRGEIACRVIRTARALGVGTVAVYSDADAGALHVADADVAVRIGPAPARASYLDVEAIVRAARETGADAVHPGYGFLSESVDLAAACAAAGIVFVGPPVEAIRAMGRKDAALALMAGAGIPVLPGYRDADQDAGTLAREAERLGFPLIVKPSAGGGGKGMRVVREAGALRDAVEGARREASAAFGDDHLILERFLERPRHVEVQVFCDTRGGAVHLLERDCSAQRRHQKIVEEAPAPGLPEPLRAAMGAAAVDAARSIDYVGAGTVEFLLDAPAAGDVADDAPFYFMEMNTRLQVEHPVTEMILGLDLVEWQLRVAAGESLPLAQAAVVGSGHAFEARVYAEDPANGFLPSTGRIEALATPPPAGWLRIDTGVSAGHAVSPHYDPMIAKVVVHGPDRESALDRLEAALDGYDVAGPATNVAFLQALVGHSAFRAGGIDTGFVDRHGADLVEPSPTPAAAQPLAAVFISLDDDRRGAARAASGNDPWSPWARLPAWRLNGPAARTVRLGSEAPVAATVVHGGDGALDVRIGERSHRVLDAALDGDTLRCELDGRRHVVRGLRRDDRIRLHGPGLRVELAIEDPDARSAAAEADGGQLTSPMPGRVAKVLVSAGDHVAAGDALLVIEAMKMEHAIVAPVAGTVLRVDYAAGEQVEEGVELVAIETD